MIPIQPILRRLLAALVMIVLAAGAAWAKPAVNGLRFGIHSDSTRVVLDLSGNLAYTVFTLPEPYRVVIDLPEVEWRLPPTASTIGRGLVNRFRFGLFRPGTSRLVLDVKAPIAVRKAFILRPTADFGHRLVLDLVAVSPAEYRRHGQPSTPSGARQAVVPVAPPEQGIKKGGKPVIAIDAGHGGVDPGTTGFSGVREKSITLAAATELKRQIEATGRYRVVMTRTRDVFVRLTERVGVARRAHADLFISLHADAIANHTVRGATVYTLSEKSSDAEAAELAAKENKSDLIAGIDLSAEAYGKDVTKILIDLMQRETMNFSARFATALIPEIAKEARLLRKTHRFAGFRVLKAPDVPSVLVEMGYLSNRKDERTLKDPVQRRKLMRAVLRAIDRFFADRTSVRRT